MKERIRWWIHHPRFELIYLLGGIPKEHMNCVHYRNIESIFKDIKSKLAQSNKNLDELANY